MEKDNWSRINHIREHGFIGFDSWTATQDFMKWALTKGYLLQGKRQGDKYIVKGGV